MSKFVIECPSCGRYAEADSGIFGTSVFGTKKIDCACGHVIDVKTEKLASRTCAHCGNSVIFDQSKGEDAVCPVCHEKINTRESMSNLVEFSCPSCSCKLSADRNAVQYTCPLCNTVINVQQQVEKETAKNKGIASLIKFEGGNDVLVWKHPIEDFNLGSQLVVHESQEAIFFRDGQALDLFGPGRYTLATQNLPLLEELYKLPTNADTVFHSEVYFINLTTQMAMKWGTADKITLIDPTSQAPIAIGARGMYNIKVANSRKLLMKLVGTTAGLNRNDLSGDGNGYIKQYFRSIIQVGVSTNLAQIITSEKIDILQIDSEKMRLSEKLMEALVPYFEDYGIQICDFLVEGIILPQQGELGYDVVQTLIKLRQANLKKSVIATETDIKLTEMEAQKTLDIRTQENAAEVEAAHRQTVSAKGETSVLETQIEGQKELAKAQAEVAAERLRMQLEMERKAQTAQIEAEEMRLKGYTQKDVLQAGVMTSFAENQPESGGSFAGVASEAMQMGAGFATMGAAVGMASNMMGTGVQMTKDIAGSMSNAMSGITAGLGSSDNSKASSDIWECSCGAKGITSKFCPECGSKKPEPVKADTWDCAACGAKGITSKFCPECGAKKPEPPKPWNCVCGASGITSKFCPECGKTKPTTWDCSCGKTGITSKFCPECGHPKGE